MNEFDLQGLEREIQAWRRRLESHDAPLIRAELNDIARDVDQMRAHALAPDERNERESVEQRLFHLLLLYDGGAVAKNAPRGSA
jgi:hypothetical protein